MQLNSLRKYYISNSALFISYNTIGDNMRLSDLQNKNLVNINNGKNIGNIIDVNIDYENGSIKSFIIESKGNVFTFLNRDTDLEVKKNDIEKIGEDVILVNVK